ncbi:MAG: ATP-binding protein [Verrucomicrobia bacterium]|nr:ATP-binding protein [Verrucomicrobiota bacterium]
MLSIKARLVLLTMLSIAAIFGICGFSIYHFARKNLVERFDQRLRVQAYSIMTSTYQRREQKVEVLFSDRFLREFSGNQRRAFYQIWKNEDEIVKRSESLGENDLPKQYGKEREPKYWDLALPNGLSGRAIGIRYEPRVRGAREIQYNEGFKVILVVATDVNEIETTLAGLRNLLTLGGIATLVLSPVFVLIALGSGLSPLKELVGRMGKVDADSLETHFDEGTLPIELRPIAGQLNDLFNRLKKSFERERQFSADVSHELRTPIAALLNIAEVGIKWKDGDSKQDYEAMRAISLEMQQTVSQLLELSRADSGHIDLHMETVAIEEVVSSIWSRHKAEAGRRQLTTKLSGLKDVIWVVDRTLFEHMVDNLINNAVSYAPVGGEIQIEVLEDGKRLVFRNVSIELEQLDIEKLFDRFWCKDSARSMDEHRGLGLAVVAAFAEKMQLQLEPRLIDEGVFEMAVIYSTKGD